MTIKIQDIMKARVISVTPHQTLGHARELLQKNKIHVLPVLGPERQVLGILSSADLLGKESASTPLSQVMTESVYTIPLYADVELAARMMRKHKIHHLVVVDEKKLAGILSSFDLLQLIEGHRFVMKNAPTPAKNGGGRRRRAESAP